MSAKMMDMLMMVLLLGGAYWAYSTGKLDSLLHGGGGGGGESPSGCDCAALQQGGDGSDSGGDNNKKSNIAYAWSAELGDYVAYRSKKKKKGDKKKKEEQPADPCQAECSGSAGGGETKAGDKTKGKSNSSEASLLAIAATGESVWEPKRGSITFRTMAANAIPGNPITNEVFPNRSRYRTIMDDNKYGVMNIQ